MGIIVFELFAIDHQTPGIADLDNQH